MYFLSSQLFTVVELFLRSKAVLGLKTNVVEAFVSLSLTGKSFQTCG